MAEALPEARMTEAPGAISVGAQVIDTLTSGMYSRPLMALREYVQNAADAIDEAVESGCLRTDDGSISITLNGRDRSIAVEDNGIGVDPTDIVPRLCSIGSSGKLQKELRGFRGIGRMGGMAYCDCLRFETRSGGRSSVSIVEWDCARLREIIAERQGEMTAEALLGSSVRVTTRAAGIDEGPHFFRVSMLGVHRFHSGDLMSVPATYRHLSEVAPVPFDHEAFALAPQVENFVRAVRGYRTYDVRLNGRRVYRPHSTRVALSAQTATEITGMELLSIPGKDGTELGRGWYATMPFRCSLPKAVGMRGIQVRQGNIRIGDEYWMQDFCSERRFSTWHIGEIHLAPKLRPNARRDGFEHSEDCEIFLEQMQLLGRHLSHICRSSSAERAGAAEATRTLDRLQSLMAPGIHIDQSHKEALREELQVLIGKIGRYLTSGALSTSQLDEAQLTVLGAAEVGPNSTPVCDALDGRSLSRIDPRTLIAEMLGRIARHEGNSVQLSPEVLADVLKPYLRKHYR
ncbi:MAG: ATP-binding protein [Armatimonadota bacterium]